ncbi:uncharacterized protein EMH_0096680 [Eimeria mitis]|uniref:Uncharacterized protein n=1 Tax=Eimeria mitis TaxID=44415 RepID=U6JR44_9EIME|nr:uncharacterized protein EMH_0096680 [Eimeria mitis]CDJ27935.1 hypothetical protein, conserved [Eimeria mitis]
MLMLETDIQDWSSARPSTSPPLHDSAANCLTKKPSSASFRDSRSESPVVLASTEFMVPGNPNFREKPMEPRSTMRVPPFLNPLVKPDLPNHGRPSSNAASSKITKTAPKEQAATSREGAASLPSAPSTASTTTAETTKVADAPFRDPSREKVGVSAAPSTLEKTQQLAAQGDAGTARRKPLQVASSPVSLAGTYKSTDPVVPAPGVGSVLDKQSSAMQQQTRLNQDNVSLKGTLPLMRTAQRTAQEGTEGTTVKAMPYNSSLACLVAALGASSLRLAAAAEEGLDSSPSDNGSRIFQTSEQYRIRRSGSAATELLQSVSPSTPETNSLAFPQRQSSAFTRRFLPAPKTTAMARSRRKLPHSSDVSRSSRFQETPLQPPQQNSPTKAVLRADRGNDTTGQKQIVNRHYIMDPILLDLPVNGPSNEPTVSGVSQGSEVLPCRNTCSPVAAGSTPSNNSGAKKSTQEIHTTLSEEATAIPTSIPDGIPWESHRRSPELPLLAHGTHRVETVGLDCASEAYHGEEEHQFSLLLQHSLGLLRREAARCFASSQASVKQKLWRELQHERHLRLQLQQEHQVGFAAAEAELVSLRAQKVEEHERLEKILEISCRRRRTEEGSQLLRFAWKGWQLQRVLTGRLKKLQQALQQRRLFMLQLRTFLPWRAAAARRTVEQQIERAQRFFQQEMQRLGQAHLESTQRQQQELRNLQQQLNSEIHLRECLQQSLIGLVAGGGVGAPQGGQTSSPGDTISFASAPSSGILNTKRQQRSKAPENRTRRQRVLRVVGTQSNLRSRQTLASQNKSGQPLDEKLQQCDYAARQPWWHWVSQNAGLGISAPLLPTLYKGDPRAASGFEADTGRRVKFTDELANQEQQSQQQKLLLLANLLSEPFPQRHSCSRAVSGGPSSAQVCSNQHCSPSGLAPASAPTFSCWELIPEISSKQNLAAVRRHSAEDNSLLQQASMQPKTMLGEKRNYSANDSWSPSPVCSFVHDFSHKQTKWTSAGQSTPAI